MLTTLGRGDILPVPIWRRILSGCHTLVGFSLVTASVTWVLLIFPALRRTRTLAHKVMILGNSEREAGVAVVSPGMHTVLAGLAEEVIRTRVDLVNFPILHYFYTLHTDWSLAYALVELRRFAVEGMKVEREEHIRLTSIALHRGIEGLVHDIGERLNMAHQPIDEILRRLVDLHTPAGGTKTPLTVER
jgi:hypothetical protein